MTSTLSTAASRTDDADLTALGYEPTLHRKLGRYASFAAGFSFVSILTTIFQLFAFGYSFAGPAFFWTWPVVLVGQLLVALNFAELAARYPLSGAVYQWSRRMGGEVVGWFAGWFMSIAQVITAAAAAIALQVVLPQLWDGFQVVGGDPALTSPTGAANAVILGAILLVITTVINCLGVKLMSHVNSIGVTCEIVGVAAVILALFSAAQRGPEVVADVSVVTTSDLGAVGAFLVSGLMAAYVMVGFNSAGELSEETKNPRKTAPRTILSALIISGIGGGLMIIAALMAAPSLDDGRLATEGLPYVLTAVLGTFWGKVLLVDVAIAIFVCTLAIQTAGSRLVFSMARDGKLPASALLAKVHAKRGTPMWPSIAIGALAVGILAINIGNSALFTTLCSVCIVMVYLAYLMVTVPQLLSRFRGDWDRVGQTMPAELFSLGRSGLPVNILAVLYGALMVINLSWPRPEVYDPSGEHGILLFSAPIMVGAVLLLGLWIRRNIRVRENKAAIAAVAADATVSSCSRTASTSTSTEMIAMTQTLEALTPANGTATTTGAKLHARAQHGRTSETMVHVPATSAPARLTAALPQEAKDSLTWAETLSFGRYTHLELARGTRLRLTDLDGDACVHAVIIRSGAQHERLNVADTVKVPWQAYMTTGHPLLSDAGRLMATVVADSSGKHDALTGTTNLAGNTAKYGAGSAHSPSPAGRELLTLGGMKHGVSQRQLPPSLSFFKGVTVGPDGSIQFAGSAGAGAAVELLLHMDAVLVLANTAHPLDPRAEFSGSAVDIVAWRAPQDLAALVDGTLDVGLGPEGRLALHNAELDYNARTSA